jgi:anaerobic selenocysteine-containing dehydrogenase
MGFTSCGNGVMVAGREDSKEAPPMKVKGCCPLDCQDSCAWIAEAEDGRVVRVTGAKDHPVTRGVLCAKVKDYETRVTAPGRLLHPLRRSGPKGSGQFETISWDAALSEIAERFSAIAAEYGGEALLPFNYLGTQGVVQRRAPMRIFHALGASRPTGGVCAVSAIALLMEGHPIGVDPEEASEAGLIILWGQNVLTTCHHQWHFIDQARKKGAKAIAIDPCATRTARQCDTHLALRPGTDAVLAAAIGRHLLDTGQADLDLARLWVADLEDYRAAVDPWTFARAAEATGLTAAEIEALATDFAAARPALIRAGIAPQQAQNGEAFVRGLSALAILGGHWRQRGGGLSILSFPVLHEDRAARSDLIAGEPRSLDIAKLGQILESADPPVMGLMVWSANPAATQIDAPRVRRGLRRDDLFTVVADHFLTDTARYADIVLPATTQFEHVDIQGAWGHHYVLANMPVIQPMGEARSSGAIMRGLAEKLGLTDPVFRESDEDIARSALPDGWSLARLCEDGWRKSPPPRPAIADLAQKLHISNGAIEVPTRRDEIQLLSPKSHHFLNSTFANMARHQKAQGEPAITLNPADAARLGLADGDRVRVTSGTGSLELALRVSDWVRPGVATIEGKWWENDRPEAAMNLVTPSKWSPAGQPAYNEVHVRVEALEKAPTRMVEAAMPG